ncbi:MAG: LPS export ABC transporter ATP-binding protein [candidate division WOR-3 bacterium]|uniref:LPS export ABC transporter ATP-binding protein n=1 Tax=candidate division WOR-3 bacterium TaxID=2052148 RepID=A0A7V4E1V7_UNCW3
MKDRIRTEKLVKIYKKRKVVNEVSISLERGEIVGLLGPNGAGKTTSFYMIIGVIKPNSGKVFLNDTDITNLPMYKRARMGISYLPQEASIFRGLKVYDNIYGVIEMNGLSKEECKRRTEEVMEKMGISHLRNSYGYSLSGGERRRVEIARSLVLNPKFLLLDEPFTGIDPKTREEIQGIILDLKKQGIGILLTDHNVRETLEITDRAYIIYEGKVLLEGTSEFLVNDETAKRIYLGEKFRL